MDLMGQMTAVQQRKMVGEGLAVGCVSLDDIEIPADRFAVEAAFRYAWPRWRGAGRFPQIRADLSRNDVLLHVIYPSEQRRGVLVAAWRTSSRTLRPYLMAEDMTPAEAAEMLSGDEGLDLTAWQDLAAGFLGRVHAYGRPTSSAS